MGGVKPPLARLNALLSAGNAASQAGDLQELTRLSQAFLAAANDLPSTFLKRDTQAARTQLQFAEIAFTRWSDKAEKLIALL